MKNIALLLASMLLCTACNFSKGMKKDLTTGLSTSYNGFAIEEAYLADENGNRLPNNQIPLGSKIQVVVTGVDNFTDKDGKVFPGCSLKLTDPSGTALLDLPDAFAEMTGGTPAAEAKVLHADLSTGNPMKVGQTYHLQTRFFDKNNQESEIVTDVDLVVR